MVEQEFEQTQSDVSQEPSSEAPESPEVKQEGEAQAESSAAPEQQQTSSEDNLPFHKHPRWVERDNELKQERAAREELQRQYARMEEKLKELSSPKTSQEKDALIERLKGIDPEFGARMERLNSIMPTVEQLQTKLQEMERQAFVSSALTKINSLHAENKVSPTLQAKYNAELDLAYRTGQIRSQEDVVKLYNQVHEGYKKIFDEARRNDRQEYVSAKKTDAKVPPSSKGKPVSPSKDFKFSDDPTIARSQIVKRALELAKAEQES